MAEARSKQEWNHTSAVLAMLANAHRDPRKSRLLVPEDFHPHRKRLESPPVKVGIAVLKQVFVDPPGLGG